MALKFASKLANIKLKLKTCRPKLRQKLMSGQSNYSEVKLHQTQSKAEQIYDFVIIGSGFGGSVSAYRLSQKGYKVAVLEKGKRFARQDFPKTNWNVFRFLWAPVLRCFGIQQITLLKGVMVLHGSGVGGGSLVYANTLMQPRAKAFQDPRWPAGFDWQNELQPFYDMAKKMLGVTVNQLESEADNEIRNLGIKLGVGESYHPTEVGVFFAPKGVAAGQEVPDPFFGGEGPSRAGCTGCGGCMVGCRIGAKNTLDQNYLYLAEKKGAQVFPETRALKITPANPSESPIRYEVECQSSTSWFSSQTQTFRAKNVIFSAGVMGTLDLLFKNKEIFKTLPKISETLGDFVRTNGESLCGATSFDAHRNLSKGIAIGSAIHIDEDTKIEPVRYPTGSNALRALAVPLTGAGGPLLRPLKMLGMMVIKLPTMLRFYLVKDWAQQSIILLVMQSLDQKIRLKMGRSLLSGFRNTLVSGSENAAIPSYMPIAQQASQILAEQIQGVGQNVISEVLLGTPATAHILGGATMGKSVDDGVCDLNHQIFNYPGLYVADGSVIPANLGVNPSLTITALSERFVSQFPNVN